MINNDEKNQLENFSELNNTPKEFLNSKPLIKSKKKNRGFKFINKISNDNKKCEVTETELKIKEIENLKNLIQDKEIIEFKSNYIEKTEKKKRNFKEKILNVFSEKKTKENSILVNMELRSGSNKTFLVFTKAYGFVYNQGRYVIDDSLKYYNTSFDYYCLDYHEDLSLPIKRKIPVNDIKETMKYTESEIEHSLNPVTLENLIVSKIAEGVMRGQAIDDFLKRIQLLIIITMVSAVILLILFIWKTGMLESVNVF